MCTVPFLSRTGRKGPSTAAYTLVIFLTFFSLAAACFASRQMSPIDALAEQLADELHKNLATRSADPPKTLVVSIVDVNQLHCTSRFGQILPERLRTFLQQKGWKIVEARRGSRVLLQENVGQFNLSDNIKDLAARVRCQAILAGTYMFHMGKVLINMRLIRLSDNVAVSAASAQIEADPWIATLLKPEGIGCKAPKAFLKIEPWKTEDQLDDNLS